MKTLLAEFPDTEDSEVPDYSDSKTACCESGGIFKWLELAKGLETCSFKSWQELE